MFDIDAALRHLVAHEGSDLHVKVPSPPMLRVHGRLSPVDGAPPLSASDTEAALMSIMVDEGKREKFAEVGEADFSHEIAGVARFRVNAFRQRGSVSIVCRAIPHEIRTIDDLDLPESIRGLAEEERGIILLTGTTGSGKSTTLAAMIDHINSTMSKHVLTLEDPIEFLHADKKSIVNQREVGSDTQDFARALRRVLRQDPDVILIGEMRDEETVATALSAAETGHLVLSTLHTVDAAETINRIIDFFPPHHQQQARFMLAATLKGAVSQRLVRTPDGNGRVAVCEVLVATGRIRDMITNPAETDRIGEAIAEGEFYGMQTFDQALLKHVQGGNITLEDALTASTSPHDFKLMLAAGGQSASSVEQLMPEGSNGNGHEPAAPVREPVPSAPEPRAVEPETAPLEPAAAPAEAPPAATEPASLPPSAPPPSAAHPGH